MAGEVSKKILWVFVFLILAAIAILGVLFIRGYHAGRDISAVTANPSDGAMQTTDHPISLTITSPATDVATTSAKIAITGTTSANANIAIVGGSDDIISNADNSGNFSVTVPLAEGLNVLQIHAYSEDGATTTATKNIVYTKGAL